MRSNSLLTKGTKQLKVLAICLFALVGSGCQSSTKVNEQPLINNVANDNDYFLIGGYGMTDKSGVYLVSYNKSSQELTNEKLVAPSFNAAYLAWQPQSNTLYSIATDAEKSPLVNQFSWNTTKQQFGLYNTIKIAGKGICHINVNDKLQQLAIANYTSGNISRFSINADTIDNIGDFKNIGKSITARQQAPFMHYVGWGNENRYLYATDLGTDEILVFDSTDKNLSPIQRIKMHPGDGPRHLVFHPTQKIVYSLNELSNSISVFKQNSDSGKLTFIDKYLLNPKEKADVTNIASAIRIDNSGQHLYAAVRGENMLYGFTINSQGKLSMINKVSTGGDHPRDFNFSPEQEYLVVANQLSHQLNIIYRDKKSGKLTTTTTKLPMTSPSYVQHFSR